MKIILYQTNLEFEYPFTISKGTKTHQPSLIVCFDNEGIKGFGEAPSIKYYNISVEQMTEDITRIFNLFKQQKFSNAAECWNFFNTHIHQNNFAICALDMAMHDWFCKKNKQSLFESFNTEWKNIPPTDYTLGFDTIEILEQKIKQHPMPIYKIKLGLGNEEEVLKKITELSNAKIRIDFNEGLTADRFLQLYPLFEKYNIELLEQPLHKNDMDGMQHIFKHSKIDLYADEFCVSEYDVEKCVGLFDGINIKLTKCGGITPALRMINNAHKLGLKIMMGSMNESSIGTAAVAHFLPQLNKVDMDGVLLLKETFASGIQFNNDAVCMQPIGFGLGVNIDMSNLYTYQILEWSSHL
jgi:L-alanine-DL-glutamate epimerase-like enolase superfamily enzyme